MSHHQEAFAKSPQKLTFVPENSHRFNGSVQLIVHGQGTFAFKAPESDSFEIFMPFEKSYRNGLYLIVNNNQTVLYLYNNSQKSILKASPTCKLDADKNATYWLSLNSLNPTIKFGIGEVRNDLTRFEYDLKSYNNGSLQKTLQTICSFEVTPQLVPLFNYRDPVVYDPALKVVSTDEITIEDIARNNYVTPSDLTESCQKLYNHISGKNFQLNTSDFPDFVDAIEGSIACKSGWCYKKLKEKATEFGKRNDDETYLRITLGNNQGESPGIPYVIEIWPPNHYSPIHNHGGANAIIRVLHGEIQVKLYPMLSAKHKDYFKVARFRKDEITWLSPRYNQFHQLHNVNKNGPTCITIQCYLYDQADVQHYEYFDYLDSDASIEQFTPNSDADFLQFKAIIKEEWPRIKAQLATTKKSIV